MNATKADAIQFLKSSIARYRHQLEHLESKSRGRASNVVDFAHVTAEREQLRALIEDAKRLLSELRPTSQLRAG
jgi:hypothetical protein